MDDHEHEHGPDCWNQIAAVLAHQIHELVLGPHGEGHDCILDHFGIERPDPLESVTIVVPTNAREWVVKDDERLRAVMDLERRRRQAQEAARWN